MPSVPEIVTGQIIDQLEKGEIPWQRPWDPEVGMPRRVPSGKPYQGINVLMLAFSPYESPFWLTLRQANSMGGHIRKGEHGRIVTFYKHVTRASDDTIDGDAHSYWLLRYYRVYNAEQTEGIDKNKWPKLPERHDVEPIACCEDVVTNMPSRPPISFDGSGRAYYQPLSDSIHLPLKDAFHSAEEFYSTQFHELAHSTGHQKRLNRPDAFGNDFGSVSYSKEELVAEMASAFLCAHCGIEKTIQNSSAYIAGWLKAFRHERLLAIPRLQREWWTLRIGMIFDNKFRSYTTGNYCYKSVQRLGYDAIHFNPLVIKNTGITYDYTGLPECDLYISIDDDFAYPGPPVPKEISAYWCIDTHRMELMAGGNLTRWQKIKHFGHVFMAQKDRAEEIGHVWLPLGYDPDISRSLNLEKVYDWCFVGSLNSPIRNSYIPILRDKFPNCYVGQAEPIEMNHIYNQSRVVLNLPSLNDLNMRFFEAVASGSLCLSKRITNGIDEIFGSSIILFDNARDMCAKMNDILRFYNFYVPRTKRDWLDHTYDSRMAKMISIIKERLRTGTIC